VRGELLGIGLREGEAWGQRETGRGAGTEEEELEWRL